MLQRGGHSRGRRPAGSSVIQDLLSKPINTGHDGTVRLIGTMSLDDSLEKHSQSTGHFHESSLLKKKGESDENLVTLGNTGSTLDKVRKTEPFNHSKGRFTQKANRNVGF